MSKCQVIQKVSIIGCASVAALIIGEVQPKYKEPASIVGFLGLLANILIVSHHL